LNQAGARFDERFANLKNPTVTRPTSVNRSSPLPFARQWQANCELCDQHKTMEFAALRAAKSFEPKTGKRTATPERLRRMAFQMIEIVHVSCIGNGEIWRVHRFYRRKAKTPLPEAKQTIRQQFDRRSATHDLQQFVHFRHREPRNSYQLRPWSWLRNAVARNASGPSCSRTLSNMRPSNQAYEPQAMDKYSARSFGGKLSLRPNTLKNYQRRTGGSRRDYYLRPIARLRKP